MFRGMFVQWLFGVIVVTLGSQPGFCGIDLCLSERNVEQKAKQLTAPTATAAATCARATPRSMFQAFFCSTQPALQPELKCKLRSSLESYATQFVFGLDFLFFFFLIPAGLPARATTK